MIEITLKAGEKFPVAATARYFVVRSVGDNVSLSVRNSADVELQNSDVIDLGATNDISLVNKSTIAQVVKFQLSPFKIDIGASKNSIKSIEDIVQVHFDEAFTIGAVNQNGEWNIHTKASSNTAHKARVNCIAGQATLLIAANERKSVRLNIRADQFAGITLGNAATVTDSSGGYLDVGMVDYLETDGALYAFVVSGNDVLVDVLEFLK
jgi:hypothetical protein